MSDPVQRLVRKLRPKGPRSFDEQEWPIYAAIVVLGGYVLGVVLSQLRFDEPRIWANAITWICLVVIAVGFGIWSVRLLQNRLLRRTLVFSVLLSLIVNLSLVIMMSFTSVFNSLWEQEQPQAITQKPKAEVVIPEYALFSESQQERVPQEYEKPVETGAIEAEQNVALTRQAVESDTSPNEMLPSPSSVDNDAQASKLRRFDAPSAPRRSETLAKLSRQTLRTELAVSRSPTKPSQQPSQSQPTKTQPTEAQDSPAEATKSSPQKQTQLVETSAPTAEVTESSRQFRRPEMSRRADSETVNQVASLPRLDRAMRRPRQLPKSATPIGSESTQPKRTDRQQPEANSTLLTKQSTTAPQEVKRVDLQPKVATNLSRANPKLDRPETETLSESLSKATLSLRSTKVPRVETPNATPSNAESRQQAQELKSSSTSLAKSKTQAPAAKVKSPRSNQPQVASAAQSVTRVQPKSTPSVAKATAAKRSISRANRLLKQATSTNTEVNAATESLAEATRPNPATTPSRMAFSRSSVGMAGVGDAANLDRGAAAPESPVNVSLAAANRAKATQQMQPGAAISPSAPSLARQMRADSETPRTSQKAEPLKTAMVPGTKSPEANATSSSATLLRAASNAEMAKITAAKGSTEIDLGPPRIATDRGNGRAEGGGQPDLTSGEVPRALKRANALAGRAQIRADTTADDVGTPAAEDVAANEATPATGADVSRATPQVTSAARASRQADGSVGSEEAVSAPDAEVRIARASGGRRADTSDATNQPQIADGGTASPGRQGRALTIQTQTESEVPSLAGVPSSFGSNQGDPLDAQGAKPKRAAVGMVVDHVGAVGAAAGEVSVDGTPDGLPSPDFRRDESEPGTIGENFALSNQNLGTPRRSRRPSMTGSSTDVELDPEEFAINTPSVGSGDALDEITSVLEADTTGKVAGGSMIVEVDVAEVEGGLGDTTALDAGIVARQAHDDSDLVSLQPARFLRRRESTAPSFKPETSVVSPTTAFQRREIRKGEELAGDRGLPSAKTEVAIELGLVFLSRFQETDGSWSLNNFADGRAELPGDESAAMVSDTAATGLSLLSFLGAGYHHRDDKYQEVVGNALDFLLKHQQEDGDLYVDSDDNSSRSAWLYSHGIAAIALCEAYGMTQDPKLREPAQQALKFIVKSQHPTRGGWRYSPQYGADTSVSGWMLMALKSGQLAGLKVEESVFEKVEHWLDVSQVSDTQPYLFRYNPYAPDTDQQRHGRQPTRAITSVGLLMRLYTGWKRDDSKMILGARTLSQNLPELGTSSSPRRDTYYWYYATQVMYHMGGEYWERWNAKLHPLLVDTQVREGKLLGSWNPQTPVPDRWGAHGGRLYVTTLNLLSLEVFYRHLPIYDETAN